MNRRSLFIGLLLLCCFQSAFGWGERGHDIIARVAARHLIEQDDSRLYRPFQLREFMLGHLANVPDIIWKAAYMDEQVRRINRPTHYINIDLLPEKARTVFDVPLTYQQYAALAPDTEAMPGSAPWRIAQLYRLMRQSFAQAKQSRQGERPDAFIRHVNMALFYGGIMSHFVGDLANPHHAAADYDGQQTGNGGLHAYFESAVVAVLDLDLAHKVLMRVNSADLIEQMLLSQYTATQSRRIKQDPLLLVFALSINSRAQLPILVTLDDDHSLLERSRGEETKAKRKPPAEAGEHYAAFIVTRLALAAAVLSQLWQLAWQQAGQPDLSSFHSYYYPAKPNFIYPDYLPMDRQ